MSKAVLFDVDGVLVDSYRAHLESWQRLAAETDVTFTQQQFHETFGRRSRDILASFWPVERFPSSMYQELDDRKEALYREIVSDSFPGMEGSLRLIDDLRRDGWQLAAASSGPPENVHLVLRRLDRIAAFGAVITGRDVRHGKPNPQVFELAARAVGVPPESCVVIEDAPAGIEAAHAAGMVAVGLCSTGRTRQELRDAELVVDGLAELTPQVLANLLVDPSA